jgi:AcrR family transcriptional regulator
MPLSGYQKRTLQKRKDILSAAKDLVSQVPLAQISIHDIASQAKVSQVTIYNIFESKNNLIFEAVKEISKEDVDDIFAVISSDLPYPKRIEEYFRHSFAHTLKRPQLNALLSFIFDEKNAELAKYVFSLYEKTYFYLQKMYLDGRKDGFIREDITVDLFFKILNIYVRIDRSFLIDEKEREIIIETIRQSFQ